MVLLALIQIAESILSSKYAAFIFWKRISSSYNRPGSNSTLLRSTQPLLALKKEWDVREARQHKGFLALEKFLLGHPQTPRMLLLFANLKAHQKMLLWHIYCGHWWAVRVLSTRHYVWCRCAPMWGKPYGSRGPCGRNNGVALSGGQIVAGVFWRWWCGCWQDMVF